MPRSIVLLGESDNHIPLCSHHVGVRPSITPEVPARCSAALPYLRPHTGAATATVGSCSYAARKWSHK